MDSSANVYATGHTSIDGWVIGGCDTTLDGSYDGYVVKLSAAGAHVWSTYFGATGDDRGYDVAVDSSGDAYVTGWTGSSGWVSDGLVFGLAAALLLTRKRA